MKRIPLTKGYEALVDDEDYECLLPFKWHALVRRAGAYAESSRWDPKRKRPTHLPMHRMIMNPPDGMVVDHRNGDTLDNRRENLRVCTPKQNLQNRKSEKGSSSRYIGVHWHTPPGKWLATINPNKQNYSLGHFDSEEDAAIARDVAAQFFFGGFARLNFPIKNV